MAKMNKQENVQEQNHKKVKQFFYLSEFKEEGAWLSLMHREGWKLVGMKNSVYEFEACEKEEYVYQLDFMSPSQVNEEYLQLFADYGWEYVMSFGSWVYFRKKETGQEEDMSIFSDNESKALLYQRILGSRRATILLGIFSISCFIVFFTIFFQKSFLPGERVFASFMNAALPWVGMGLFVATAFTANQYYRVSKMMKKYSKQ